MSNKLAKMSNAKGEVVKIVPKEQKFWEEDLAAAEFNLDRAEHAVRMNREIIKACKVNLEIIKSQSSTNST